MASDTVCSRLSRSMTLIQGSVTRLKVAVIASVLSVKVSGKKRVKKALMGLALRLFSATAFFAGVRRKKLGERNAIRAPGAIEKKIPLAWC